jgi:hypothetical protein
MHHVRSSLRQRLVYFTSMTSQFQWEKCVWKWLNGTTWCGAIVSMSPKEEIGCRLRIHQPDSKSRSNYRNWSRSHQTTEVTYSLTLCNVQPYFHRYLSRKLVHSLYWSDNCLVSQTLQHVCRRLPMQSKGEDRWTWIIALLGGSGLELIERRSGQYLYVVNYSSHSPLWPIHHMILYPIIHKWSTCQSVGLDRSHGCLYSSR